MFAIPPTMPSVKNEHSRCIKHFKKKKRRVYQLFHGNVTFPEYRWRKKVGGEIYTIAKLKKKKKTKNMKQRMMERGSEMDKNKV